MRLPVPSVVRFATDSVRVRTVAESSVTTTDAPVRASRSVLVVPSGVFTVARTVDVPELTMRSSVRSGDASTLCYYAAGPRPLWAPAANCGWQQQRSESDVSTDLSASSSV